jgi:hypothetical protein
MTDVPTQDIDETVKLDLASRRPRVELVLV